MSGRILLDDHLLLRVLLDQEPAPLRPEGGEVFTTGLWYHRLSRALSDGSVTGAMSRQLGDLPADLANGVVAAVAGLPDEIGLVSLRDLAWPMASLLAHGPRLNLLSLEALAAARHLDAEICLARDDDNPSLATAARIHGVPLRLLD